MSKVISLKEHTDTQRKIRIDANSEYVGILNDLKHQISVNAELFQKVDENSDMLGSDEISTEIKSEINKYQESLKISAHKVFEEEFKNNTAREVYLDKQDMFSDATLDKMKALLKLETSREQRILDLGAQHDDLFAVIIPAPPEILFRKSV